MATLTANVADALKLDRLDISLGSEPSVGSFHTAYLEAVRTISEPEQPTLTAADYPLLAAIWDNEEDAVYDDL